MRIKSVDLKYRTSFELMDFAILFFIIYLVTGTLYLKLPVVIGAGFFGGEIIGSMMKRLYKEGKKEKQTLSFLLLY